MALRHALFVILALLLQAPQPPSNLRRAQPSNNVTTYYVSKTGNDANDGLNPITAKLTINAAMSVWSGGDTIVVRAGTYVEQLDNESGSTNWVSGSSGAPSILKAQDGESVWVAPTGVDHVATILSRNYITIDGIKIDGTGTSYLSNDSSVGLKINGSSHHVIFKNGELKFAANGIQVADTSGFAEIRDNYIHDIGNPTTAQGGHGVYLGRGDSVIDSNIFDFIYGYCIQLYSFGSTTEVHDNVVSNNRCTRPNRQVSAWGGIVVGSGPNNKVINNVVADVPGTSFGDAIAVGFGATNTLVANNTIYDANRYSVHNYNADDTTVRNNISYLTSGIFNELGSGFVESNNLSSDPDFTDAPNGDFTLQSGSPAIEAGTDLSSIFTTDIDGKTRGNGTTTGTAWDIGAHEFGTSEEPPPTGGLDTPAKRKSAIGLALHFLRPGIIPTGSNIDTVDERLHVQTLYASESADPEDVIVQDSLRERLGLSDRVTYSLLEADLAAAGERVGLRDRLTYSLLEAVGVTLRERIGMSDRATAVPAEAIARTLRERIGLSDIASGGSQQPYGPAMVALTHLYLDEGTENYSGHHVIAPAHTHTAKIINFGSIEKEVEVPSGAPRLADITIRADDSPDPITGIQHFRATFGAKTPRTRKMDVLIGPVGGKESLFYKPAKVSIQHVTFPPLMADIHGTDQRFKQFAKPLPNVINPTNFPNLPIGVTDAFFKIVFGNVSSVGYGDQGALKCTHVDTLLHRYDAAFHHIEGVTVYTKTPDQTAFQVTPFSYTKVNEELIINERHWFPTYIQFDSALPEGTEVRADIEGNTFRDYFGTIPALDGVSRNAVDHIIVIIQIVKYLENLFQDTADYDVSSFAAVMAKFEALGYLADYAITEPLTPDEIFTQLCAPFQIYMIPDKFDRIKLVLITDEDFEDAPTLTDSEHTLLRSEMISLANPTKNRYRYRYAHDAASGQWGAEGTYDNTTDQEVLGEIEELQVDLYSIRDEDVAELVMSERSLWEDHESHRIRLQVDAARNLDKLDLLTAFKLSHYGGLAPGGWVEELFIVYRYRLVIDKPLVIEIDAIRRPIVHNPEENVGLIGEWSWNSRVGPEYLVPVRRAYLWFVDNRASNRKLVVLETDATGELIPVDDGIYPTLTNQIGSHDGIFVGVMLHLFTQEVNTGRAAYSRFNASTRQYEILNATILASNSHGDYGITGDVQDPSGKVTVMLQGDREYSSGFPAFPAAGPAGYYQRAYVTVRNTNGTWTTPEMMGDPADAFAGNPWFVIWGDPNYNGSVHIQTGRACAGFANRVHFAFSRIEPGDVALTPDFMIQTLRADGTLSAAYEWETTGGGGGGANSSPFLAGDAIRHEDSDGQVWIGFAIGKLSEPKIVMWHDIDNTAAPVRMVLLSTAQVQPDTFGARWAPIGIKELDGTLHVLHGTRAPSSTEWAAYKTIDEPFDSGDAAPSYTANSRDVRVGAIFGVNDYARSGFDIKTLRDGHTYIFKVTSGNFGISGVNDGKWIFEVIDVADLPTSYTLAEFIADNP